MHVAVSDDHQPVQLLSLEDLIIDRLEAYTYGKDKDSLGWAKALYTLGQRNSLRLDETLLIRLAQTADVSDVLETFLCQ